MNSLSEIWDSVVAQLSTSLTPTAINTWFSEVTPIALNDNKLVIHTPTDFKRNIIVQRFANTIKECMSDLFACPFDLVVLAGDEITDYQTQVEVDNGLP